MTGSIGFYLMHRGWLDNPAFGGKREPFCRRAAWAWLIEEASWNERRVNVAGAILNLGRGELAHSVRFMATAWGWPKSNVPRFIDRLVSEAMIGTRIEAGHLIITICNYTEYQALGRNDGTATGTPSGTAAGQRWDSSGTNENQINQINEVNQKKGDSALPRTAPATEAVTDEAVQPDGDVAQPQPDLLGDVPKPKRRIDEVPAAVAAWNQMAARVGLAVAKSLPTTRRRNIAARLADHGLAGWLQAVAMVGDSRNLCGDNTSGFKADIDYLSRELNFAGVIEGKYADRNRTPARAAPGHYRSVRDEEARARFERNNAFTLDDVLDRRPKPNNAFEGETIDHTDHIVLEDPVV